MQLLCLYGLRKSKPRLKSELRKQQYTVTLFDRSHLAHVRQVVLWQMQNFKCYSKFLCFILNLRKISKKFVFFQIQAPRGLYLEG